VRRGDGKGFARLARKHRPSGRRRIWESRGIGREPSSRASSGQEGRGGALALGCPRPEMSWRARPWPEEVITERPVQSRTLFSLPFTRTSREDFLAFIQISDSPFCVSPSSEIHMSRRQRESPSTRLQVLFVYELRIYKNTAARQAVGNSVADSSYVARRTARHLDDLERANYVDATGTAKDESELARRRKEAEEEGIVLGNYSISRRHPGLRLADSTTTNRWSSKATESARQARRPSRCSSCIARTLRPSWPNRTHPRIPTNRPFPRQRQSLRSICALSAAIEVSIPALVAHCDTAV
jgi:hypothetical protein